MTKYYNTLQCLNCPYLNSYRNISNNLSKSSPVTVLGEQKLSPQKFNILYPFIPNSTNNEATTKINTAITNVVSNLFKSQVLYPEKIDFNEIYGTYEITANKNSILSILFSIYTYIDRAAHGYTYYSSITANTATGQIYSFNDLFNPKMYYVGLLNELAMQYIKDNSITLIAEYKAITPDQKYYLTENSLVLYYQVYDYTPYVYGLFKIEIPFNKIKNLLTPYSPITKLIMP